MVIIEAPETLSIAIIITIITTTFSEVSTKLIAHTSTVQFDSDQVMSSYVSAIT